MNMRCYVCEKECDKGEWKEFEVKNGRGPAMHIQALVCKACAAGSGEKGITQNRDKVSVC
jgi:hypothetical protein